MNERDPQWLKKLWLGMLHGSLWICAIGISVFSAGIDGEWMASFQEWRWMGYAQNLTGDIAGEVLMYHFAKLQKENRVGSKKWKASWVILGGSILMLGYSWFFSWRQLMITLAGQPPWVPVICATFAPALLGFVGYTQAIVESKLEKIETKEQRDYERELKQALKEQETRLRLAFADEMAYSRRAPEWSAQQAMERDGSQCFYCGVDMQNWKHDEIHVDHFYPVSRGGSDNPINLVVSCAPCNLSKGAREPTPDEVHQLKLSLIASSDLLTKDKILLSRHLGVAHTQKAIADALGVSASYVSAVLKDIELDPSIVAIQFGATLNQVGQPPIQKTQQVESPKDNGKVPAAIELIEA